MLQNIKNLNNIINNQSLNIEKMFATRIWIFKNEEKKKDQFFLKRIKNLLKFFLRVLYASIFTKPLLISPNTKKNSIFFIRKYSRTDIDRFTSFYENISDTTVCIFAKRDKKFDLFTFFLSIFFLIRLRKSFLKILNKNGISFFSFFTFNILIEFLGDISDILKIFPYLKKHDKLVSFQEMAPIENLICQIANIIGIKTFALQHAISAFSEEGTYEMRYPITAYLGTVCNHILCWGNFNKSIYEKYTNAKIFKLGKPILPEKKEFIDGVTIIFEDKFNLSTNKELLLISKNLKKNGIYVSRWFKKGHNLIKNIEGREGPLRRIVIGAKSSLLFELGYLGYEVYFTSQTNIKKYIPNTLIINDINTLIKKNFSSINYPHNFWKNFIECTGEESMKRYKNILFN
tara:strand:+ start:566 stop:1771 length:1206 start_codon:yes stop_codon:yes gene_type:complete